MPYCRTIAIPGGGHAMIRFSGRPPVLCMACGVREHTLLCDAIDRTPYSKKGSKTCDAPLCKQCTVSDGQQDFCPAHDKLAK